MDKEVRGRLSGHGFSTKASLLICKAKQGGSKGDGPLGRKAYARDEEAESEANVGRGKAQLSPSKGALGKTGVVSRPLPRALFAEKAVFC